jgi:membrane-bound serine protease (ClpP class)
VALELGDAAFEDVAMNPFQSIIHLLSDPNVAFILLTLGFYGLLFELQSPNFVTGILGAIALILAFIGFGSLPLNIAGLILIGLAVLLFVLETTVTSHGLLTVGGLVCFVLGAFTLYTAPGSPAAPDVAVAIPLIVAMAAVTALYVGLVLLTVARVRRRSLSYAGVYGAGGTMTVPPGTVGVAKTALQPIGVVYAAGEEWTARAGDGSAIPLGQPVRVIGQEDLTLIVESGPAITPEPG